ncbi:AzlC family ABC transporter permease [Photobacterium lucens]|uniref:AzlC family ABC transporter permease n=1 Tax=Photobacterium lucens TaxID=2562949 RepID=UPI0006B4C768|nr:AzlC family ABC transporter permease [Photobacterium lucens]KPA53171.1 branched-chain amino acid ABC transporter permease [Photobacterium leiognathi subsp. mandapamensis]MBP2699861.1 AzlC family ABC transporter permease [Vibrio parahaemolyticus]MZG56960.1 branched-chain amino acid ABC transporter permease [Photobacterium lucens]MZG80149.1 branched-chain amino acid ABC transporter permease [Photobacterium lucens]
MKKQLIQAGLKAIFPLCVGAFPFSFIVGAISINAGMSVLQSTLWSMTVFAGSAQMVALGLVQSSTELIVIALTTFVINLRHVLYSASLSEYVKEYSMPTRALMAYGLTDEVYAATVGEMKQEKPGRHWFYLAAMFGFWVNWVVADFFGAVIGSSFPHIADYGLDFAMVAAFIAIVIPQVKSRECIVAAVVATVTGILLSGLPYSLGLVVAAIVGVYAGYRMDLSTERMEAELKEEVRKEIKQEQNDSQPLNAIAE